MNDGNGGDDNGDANLKYIGANKGSEKCKIMQLATLNIWSNRIPCQHINITLQYVVFIY